MPKWVIFNLFCLRNILFYYYFTFNYFKFKKVCSYLAIVLLVKQQNSKFEKEEKQQNYAVLVDSFSPVTIQEKQVLKQLKSIEMKLAHILEHLGEKSKEHSLNSDWHFAAKVLDRLFLCISVIYAVISFSIIILSIRILSN